MALNLRAERSYLSLIQLLIAHQSPNLCRHHSESFIILISLVAEGTKAKKYGVKNESLVELNLRDTKKAT